MEFCEKIISCSPDKGITSISGPVFDELLGNWLSDVCDINNLSCRVVRLENIAELCRQQGRYATAIRLLNNALDACLDTDESNGNMHHKGMAWRLAERIDELWRSSRPDVKRPSVARWVQRHYTEQYWNVMGEINECLLEAYMSVDPIPDSMMVTAGPRP